MKQKGADTGPQAVSLVSERLALDILSEVMFGHLSLKFLSYFVKIS